MPWRPRRQGTASAGAGSAATGSIGGAVASAGVSTGAGWRCGRSAGIGRTLGQQPGNGSCIVGSDCGTARFGTPSPGGPGRLPPDSVAARTSRPHRDCRRRLGIGIHRAVGRTPTTARSGQPGPAGRHRHRPDRTHRMARSAPAPLRWSVVCPRPGPIGSGHACADQPCTGQGPRRRVRRRPQPAAQPSPVGWGLPIR